VIVWDVTVLQANPHLPGKRPLKWMYWCAAAEDTSMGSDKGQLM